MAVIYVAQYINNLLPVIPSRHYIYIMASNRHILTKTNKTKNYCQKSENTEQKKLKTDLVMAAQ